MSAYRATRKGTVIVTETASTTGVAERVAERRIERALDGLIGDYGAGAAAAVTEVSVHENPVGPFEPYRIAVAFSVTLPVDADDEDAAADAVDEAVAGTLADAGLDAAEWTFDGEASVESTEADRSP